MGFINALASYLVVFLVFVAVIAVAVFLGITLRKKKNETEQVEIAADNTDK